MTFIVPNLLKIKPYFLSKISKISLVPSLGMFCDYIWFMLVSDYSTRIEFLGKSITIANTPNYNNIAV